MLKFIKKNVMKTIVEKLSKSFYSQCKMLFLISIF